MVRAVTKQNHWALLFLLKSLLSASQSLKHTFQITLVLLSTTPFCCSMLAESRSHTHTRKASEWLSAAEAKSIMCRADHQQQDLINRESSSLVCISCGVVVLLRGKGCTSQMSRKRFWLVFGLNEREATWCSAVSRKRPNDTSRSGLRRYCGEKDDLVTCRIFI